LPLCLAAWLYYRYLRASPVWPYLLAGLLTGFSFQLRFFSALIGLALLYIEWNFASESGFSRTNSIKGALRRLGAFAIGFVLMQILFALYLLGGHALGAYLTTEFAFASRYARLGGDYSPEGLTFRNFQYAARSATIMFVSTHLLIFFPAAIALASSLRKCGDRHVREIALIAVTAYAGVLIQAKFFWYHWLAVLPWVSLLGGYGLAILGRSLLHRRPRAIAYAAVAVAVAALVFLTPEMTEGAINQWRGLGDYFAGGDRRHAYLNTFGPYDGGTFSYLADVEVADYIRARTQPGDTIYNYGYAPLVYLLSGRDSPTRFFYVFPVISTWTPPGWRADWVRDLNNEMPRYILVQANEGAPWITGLHEDTGRYATHDADLQDLLSAHYSLETTIEHFAVYRRSG
jgi:hypothetical protein